MDRYAVAKMVPTSPLKQAAGVGWQACASGWRRTSTGGGALTPAVPTQRTAVPLQAPNAARPLCIAGIGGGKGGTCERPSPSISKQATTRLTWAA